MEYAVLWFFFIVSTVSIFFWLPKQPVKDWLLVFFIKGSISTLIDSYIVAYGYIEYPVRLLPDIFQIHILYDMLFFPCLCVFYNQTTYHSKLKGILLQTVIYSIPMCLLEYYAVHKSRLIVYHSWNIYLTFLFLVGTFLLVRGIMGLIRKYSI
ncbi:MAG: hypothetical protein K0S39_1230 [Paenibacillus sp.]|jgi:hypothetical protein|nr:hypothetical protein [Paenibacillus sp.]